VVNVVALESYLQGVVAGEVPYSWPAEVLKAQAVAARSYAIASLLKGQAFRPLLRRT
jgi:stage II sporulation protein D